MSLENVRETLAELIKHTIANETLWGSASGPKWTFPSGLPQGVLQRSKKPIVLNLSEPLKHAFEEAVARIIPEWKLISCLNSRLSSETRNLVLSIILRIFDETTDIANADKTLSKFVAQFVDLVETRKAKFFLAAPVENLNGIAAEDCSIKLSDTLIVRKFTAREIDEIWNDPFLSNGTRFYPTEFGIFSEFSADANFGNGEIAVYHFQPAVEEIRRLETCLRLVKSGGVACDRIYVLPITPHCERFKSGGFDSGNNVGFSPIEIDENDIKLILNFWPKVAKREQLKLALAVDRLALAEIRQDPRDKILDAAIGLESILLQEKKNSLRGELGYRFSLNYAAITEDRSQRWERFDRARSLYNIRSKIAHGADPGIDEQTLSKLAAEYCSMLREALHHFFHNDWPPQENFWTKRILA